MKRYFKIIFFILILLTCMGTENRRTEAAEVPITAEYFPEEWMREELLKPEYDLNSDGVLSEEENKRISILTYDANFGDTVPGMKGMEYLSELKEVSLQNMKGDEVTIDKTEVPELAFCNPQIGKLKVSCEKLKKLDIFGGGSIARVDVRECVKLNAVECNYSSGVITSSQTIVSSLWVSGCLKLKSIYYPQCGLEQIKVKDCPNITGIDVRANRLKSLKIKSKKIIDLDCSDNLLTKLDITQYKNLEKLNCNNNKIEKLDFRNCKKLVAIRCRYNKLTKVELPRFENSLTGFTFTGNRIKHVKVSDVNVLGGFICERVNDTDAEEVDSSFARNRIKTVDISSTKKIDQKIRIQVKRFFTGDYVKRRYEGEIIGTTYVDIEDRELKNRPIKKIIISKNLRQKDKKWIEKLGKEYKVKVVLW